MILQHIGKRIPYAKNDIGWFRNSVRDIKDFRIEDWSNFTY